MLQHLANIYHFKNSRLPQNQITNVTPGTQQRSSGAIFGVQSIQGYTEYYVNHGKGLRSKIAHSTTRTVYFNK